MTDYRSERPADLSHAIGMVRAATQHEITEALNAMRTPIDPVAVPGMDGSQRLRVEQQGDEELHRHDTTVTPGSVRTPQLGNQNPPTDLDIAVIAAAIRIAETARPCPTTRYEAITAIAADELRRIAYLVFDQGIKAPAPDEDEHHDGVDVQQAETVHGGGFCLMPGCYDEPPLGAPLCVERTPAEQKECSHGYVGCTCGMCDDPNDDQPDQCEGRGRCIKPGCPNQNDAVAELEPDAPRLTHCHTIHGTDR